VVGGVERRVESRREQVRWLGAAGFELALEQLDACIDPFQVPGVGRSLLADVRRRGPDVVFVTHGHLDHARDVPALVRSAGTAVYAATRVCELLHDLGVPARQLHPLAGGRHVSFGKVSVLAVPTRHARFDPLLMLRALRRIGRHALRLLRTFGAYPCGDVLGYRFQTPGGTCVHFGTAGWYRAEMTQLRPDVAFLPLQGHTRINERVARAAAWLRPRRLVVHHHDDCCPPVTERVDAAPFVALMSRQQPAVNVVVPVLGEWFPLYG
jgi:L-ascorbate metabolism protein UlaG (beta-lactamase superfamily)